MELVLLVADLHANLPALQAVLADARDQYRGHELNCWFLGDLFGRGPHPYEVWDTLLGLRPEAIVAGNHDFAISGRNHNDHIGIGRTDEALFVGSYNDRDWIVLMDHRRRLRNLTIDRHSGAGAQTAATYLATLPLVYQVRSGVYMVHGGLDAPFQPPEDAHAPDAVWWDRWAWEYVKRPIHVQHTLDGLRWLAKHWSSRAELRSLTEPIAMPAVVLVGHWHFQRLYHNGIWHVNDMESHSRTLERDSWIELDATEDKPVLISPGSVGFSAEPNNRDACYAILLLANGRVTHVQFRAVAYNRASVRTQMAQLGYPAETINRLCLPGECDDAGSAVDLPAAPKRGSL